MGSHPIRERRRRLARRGGSTILPLALITSHFIERAEWAESGTNYRTASKFKGKNCNTCIPTVHEDYSDELLTEVMEELKAYMEEFKQNVEDVKLYDEYMNGKRLTNKELLRLYTQ